MKRVLELEVWTKPGRSYPLDYGKVFQEEIWRNGIPSDMFLGISTLPDKTDVDWLNICIQNKEASEEEFYFYCRSNNLVADLKDHESAYRFIEFKYGKCIAWVHFPEGAPPELLNKLRRLIDQRGFLLVNPDEQK